MRLFIIILIVSLNICLTKGQVFNDTIFPYNLSPCFGRNIVQLSDTSLCTTFITSHGGAGNKLVFAEVNFKGRIIHQKEYSFNGYNNDGIYLKKHNNCLYALGYRNYSSTDGWHHVFYKLNINLDTLFCRIIGDTIRAYAPRGMTIDRNGNIVTGGFVYYDSLSLSNPNQNPNFGNPIIIVYDTLGNLRKFLEPDLPYSEEIYGIESTDSGGYVIAGTWSNIYSSNLNNRIIRATYWVLDSTGNVLNQTEFKYSGYGSRFNHINKLEDGNILAIGIITKNFIPEIWNGYQSALLVVKLNQNGQVLWRKDINEFIDAHSARTNSLYSFSERENGDVLLAGTVGGIIDTINSNEYSIGLMYMLDKDGGSKWYKTIDMKPHFTNFTGSMFTDITCISDTSFFIVGGIYSDLQPLWLVHTDTLGCYQPDSCAYPIWVGEKRYFSNHTFIYPNPADNYFNVDLTTLTDAVTINIINAQGKLVLTELIESEIINLNLSDFSSGIYFVQILDKSRLVLKSEKLLIRK